MSFTKLVFGVALGILVAAAIAWGIYYVTPAAAAGRHEAEIKAIKKDVAAEVEQLRASVGWEREVIDLNPGSPCEQFTGAPFRGCIAERHLKLPADPDPSLKR